RDDGASEVVRVERQVGEGLRGCGCRYGDDCGTPRPLDFACEEGGGEFEPVRAVRYLGPFSGNPGVGIEEQTSVEDLRRGGERLAGGQAATDGGLRDPVGKFDVGASKDKGLVEELVAVDVTREGEDRVGAAQRDGARDDLLDVEARGPQDRRPDVSRMRGVDVAVLVRVDQHRRWERRGPGGARGGAGGGRAGGAPRVGGTGRRGTA